MEREILREAKFQGRNGFGRFLNDRGLVDKAVEIGTHRGGFAKQLLVSWGGRKLYCIDPWCDFEGYEYQAKLLRGLGGNGNRDADFEAAQEILKPYGDRVEFIRKMSMDALEDFPDETLDFVHLDGDHRNPQVERDLWNWWQKIKSPGGVLAGHDFLCPHEDGGGWGRHIQPAVLEFAQNQDVIVYMVREKVADPWSFYMIKGEKR